MATAKTEAEKAARDAVKDAEPKDDEPTFTQEVHVRDAFQISGHPPHVVAGALSAVTKKELTVTEVKAAVTKFEKAEVATVSYDEDDD